MILDAHTHIGAAAGFTMPSSRLVAAMDRAGVDRAWVSHCGGVEVDSDLRPVRPGPFGRQLAAARATARVVAANPGRFEGLLWIKPATEGFNAAVADFMQAHRQAFLGFKVHPYHSDTRFDDARIAPYLEFADAFGLVVLVHTAVQENSSPSMVARVAQRYPGASFVMAHLGLATDNAEAIGLLGSVPNLYGDTTWVPFDHVVTALNAGGDGRLLFGSDAPIDGVHTYDFYRDHLRRSAALGPAQWDALHGGTAASLAARAWHGLRD